ncbi:NAAT family transporter [bacterium]|nr:NAAT family transporter [bacterium]MBU1989350.1 NAAT family transporter [bacterium]
MGHDITFYLQITIAIFTILDPLAVIPIFLSLTSSQNDEEKRKTIRQTVKAVAIILIVAALAGNMILEFFGINVDYFKIAGGILLLLIALNMLQAKAPLIYTTPKEQIEAEAKNDISIVPLAIPLLAGPGTISTVIVFSSSMQTVGSQITFVAIILAISATIWPILLLSKWIGEKIGSTGINIAIRIMGLILASISVKFIMEGVKASL